MSNKTNEPIYEPSSQDNPTLQDFIRALVVQREQARQAAADAERAAEIKALEAIEARRLAAEQQIRAALPPLIAPYARVLMGASGNFPERVEFNIPNCAPFAADINTYGDGSVKMTKRFYGAYCNADESGEWEPALGITRSDAPGSLEDAIARAAEALEQYRNARALYEINGAIAKQEEEERQPVEEPMPEPAPYLPFSEQPAKLSVLSDNTILALMATCIARADESFSERAYGEDDSGSATMHARYYFERARALGEYLRARETAYVASMRDE